MKKEALYNILDLIEEIEKVDEMTKIHSNSDSDLMLNQYKNQKLKLTNLLFKELFENYRNNSEIMYLYKLLIEKFYQHEINHHQSLEKDISLSAIEKAIS